MRTFNTTTLTLLVLIASLFLTGATTKSKHVPPPIWLDFTLTETSLKCKVVCMVPCFDDWMHVSRAQRLVATKEEQKLHFEAIRSWFKKNPLVTIDGLVVEPRIEELKFVTKVDHEQISIDYAEVYLDFSVKSAPKKILLRWEKFNIFPSWPIRGMDALFAWDDEQIALSLDDEESTYMWHAPLKKALKPKMPEPPADPPRIDVPQLSIACLVGLVFFVLVTYILGLGVKVRWIGVGILALAAILLQGQMVKTMRPPWADPAALPTEIEARDIFAVLQRNTYRAFDHENEEQIYDVLARSVDGSLLERIYGEIFESLVLREDGGVVCKVRKVEILKSDIELPRDPEKREFKVKAKWQVVGRVGHYGHEHIRAIRYVARYVLRERENGWRISEVEVMNQRRVDVDDLNQEK